MFGKMVVVLIPSGKMDFDQSVPIIICRIEQICIDLVFLRTLDKFQFLIVGDTKSEFDVALVIAQKIHTILLKTLYLVVELCYT